MDIFKLLKAYVIGSIINAILIGLLYILALFYLSPILIGLFIMLVVNGVSLSKRKKAAHWQWHVATIAVMILASVMLWKDLASEAIDFGGMPFAILGIFGLGSAIGYAVWGEVILRKKKRRELLTWEELPEEIQKCIRTSRIVAIVCTVMAVIGALIAATGSADISESLPPTLIFGIVAAVCWGIVGKKHYKEPEKWSEEQIPAAFADRVSEEYREFFHELPPDAFVRAVYDDYQNWDGDLKEDPVWEDYPAPDYNALHTYCRVVLDDSGRSYYYRTKDLKLKVGDGVFVPAGRNGQKKIGVITAVEKVIGHDAPYPLERTKFIIGKVK